MNNQDNKLNKFFRLLWLIPVIALGYIGWANLLPFGGVISHSIDIGSHDTEGMAILTGPFNRVSEPIELGNQNHRELEHSLVYFEVKDTNLLKASGVAVSIRFRDDFPPDAAFVLGARNGPEWAYSWREIYVPFYEELTDRTQKLAEKNITVYSTGGGSVEEFSSVEDFIQNPPLGAIIATNDTNLPINQSPVNIPLAVNAPEHKLTIDTSFRGTHTLWTYVNSDTLELVVVKQDLNWYEEPDELLVEIYTVNDELLSEIIIPDDGDSEASKELGPLQEDIIIVDIPQPGAFRIELKNNDDLLINRIEINQPKLVVAKRLYLAGNNPIFYPGTAGVESVDIFGVNYSESPVSFYTWHNAGLQTVSVSGGGYNETVEINEVQTSYATVVASGDYQISVPLQDLLIKTPGYFSFSPESYFLPRRCELVSMRYDIDWLLKNTDYLIINTEDYSAPVNDEGWLIAETQWWVNDLYIINDSLRFSLNVPHIASNPEYPIAVDRIDIILEIEPIWKRP